MKIPVGTICRKVSIRPRAETVHTNHSSDKQEYLIHPLSSLVLARLKAKGMTRLIFFLFFVGLELDLLSICRFSSIAFTIVVVIISFPFVLALASPSSFLQFVVFTGVGKSKKPARSTKKSKLDKDPPNPEPAKAGKIPRKKGDGGIALCHRRSATSKNKLLIWVATLKHQKVKDLKKVVSMSDRHERYVNTIMASYATMLS
ncbi:hypothetical protein Fmac_012474 [Flemingia macrophylla]|uniref:Uncharacterized protein n=1 Tax=Flemingia macrophylla TaxID=520843 RepID=A0ABD1MRA2_9FABA